MKSHKSARRGARILLISTLACSSAFAQGDNSFGALGQLSETETLKVKNTLSQNKEIQSLLSEPLHTLKLSQRVETSDGFQTLKYKHHYNGIEVLGSGAAVHLSEEFPSTTFSAALFSLDTQANLSPEDAVSLASTFAENSGIQNLALSKVPTLKILLNPDQVSAELIYVVEMHAQQHGEPGADYWINAQNGEILAEIPHHLEIAPIHVFDAAKVPLSEINPFDGSPLVINLSSMRHVVKDSQVIAKPTDSGTRALDNSKKTLDYFMNTFGRKSFDDEGSSLVSIVHAGRGWANAFWDRKNKFMAYGSGDGERLDDMTKSLDIAGHELSHGVISSTANLTYVGESGALNEALADYFGKMIEGKNNWVVGTDIFLDKNVPADQRGMRNMANPAAIKTYFVGANGEPGLTPAPAHVSQMLKTPKSQACSMANDRCYVHGNSTVISHLAYLIHQAIGKNRTEHLLYQTLTHRLTETSNFKQFKSATLAACRSLYTSFTCKKVTQSFAAVGL